MVNATTLESYPQPSAGGNGWNTPGHAAYDFRSDTLTEPNADMLEAIIHATLTDACYGEDPTTNDLEAHVASLTGHEAGLLVMSGTMGNQVALRSHLTTPPHSILCDARSHIITAEAGAVSTLSGAMLIPVTPANNRHLTLEEIEGACMLSDCSSVACPTQVISLENTIHGMVIPLDEIKRISAFAKQHGIKLHLDGARLWECVAAGAGSLSDFAQYFDSVSLCFSKGLGAPIGSIVVGSKAFVAQATRVRKMFGGATRQSGVISAAARVAVDKGLGRLQGCHLKAKALSDRWESRGGALMYPTETNMLWLDLDKLSSARFKQLAAEKGITVGDKRVIVHYQISDEAIKHLESVLDELAKEIKAKHNGVVG